jgi:hypothetical protein
MGPAETESDGIHHVTHDGENEGPLSDTLVEAVAAPTGTAPSDLPSLGARIDVAALGGLWDAADPEPPSDGCLTLTYSGFVVVRSIGTVFLCEAAEGVSESV